MKKKILILTAIILIATVMGCGIYVSDYYHAEEDALMCAAQPSDGITVMQQENRMVFAPKNPKIGMIFYPGGKVEYSAYAPLMEACAEKGVLCVLVEMPVNLAVLDMDAADGIVSEMKESYGNIEEWYMAGHSLGGSMAASYIAENDNDFTGLILLAAYSTADLTETELQVVSIYGDKDQVLNLEKYAEYRKNLPDDAEEIIIEGGCHAYFGKYGMQEGDGQPEITQDEQIKITTEKIADLAA